MSVIESVQHLEDEYYMRLALAQAERAATIGEVPVGAVIVSANTQGSARVSAAEHIEAESLAAMELDSRVLAATSNRPIIDSDPSAHAEVLAIRKACKQLHNYRIPGATLYVTIEPCAMCLGALVHARIQRVVFGAAEPKSGVLVSNRGLLNDACFNHQFELRAGVLEQACSDLISGFFSRRRAEIKARKKASQASELHSSPPRSL